MRLENVIKILLVALVVVALLSGMYAYKAYNNLCNNEVIYSSVEYVSSDHVYKICGADFGIVNAGSEDVEVSTIAVNSEVTSESQVENDGKVVDTTDLASGESLPVKPSSTVVYQIENKKGNDLDNDIQLKKNKNQD